jgi:hypothetical protein
MAFGREYCGASETEIQLSLCDPLDADPEVRWASWQRAPQAGMLSPNDVRLEEGWPASADPTPNSIAPPNASAAALAGGARFTARPIACRWRTTSCGARQIKAYRAHTPAEA